MANLSRDEIMNMSHENTVGLIYSRSDLHQYLVELIHDKHPDYIHQGKNLSTYTTLDDAVRDAEKHGAKCFFLCLDNTYDECGTEPAIAKFNYLPVFPKH